MATVLHRVTKELRRSVNTPDFPVADWIINPDLTAVVGFASKYWTISGDVVSLMARVDRDTVDATEAVAATTADRTTEKSRMDTERVLIALATFVVKKLNEARINPTAVLPAITKAEAVTTIKAEVDKI